MSLQVQNISNNQLMPATFKDFSRSPKHPGAISVEVHEDSFESYNSKDKKKGGVFSSLIKTAGAAAVVLAGLVAVKRFQPAWIENFAKIADDKVASVKQAMEEIADKALKAKEGDKIAVLDMKSGSTSTKIEHAADELLGKLKKFSAEELSEMGIAEQHKTLSESVKSGVIDKYIKKPLNKLAEKLPYTNPGAAVKKTTEEVAEKTADAATEAAAK